MSSGRDPVAALDDALLEEILEFIESRLAQKKAVLASAKKAALIWLLYTRFASSGAFETSIGDRYIKLAIS